MQLKKPGKKQCLKYVNCEIREISPEMYAVTKLEKIHQNCQICQADFALTNLMKIQHNFQFRQTDFPLRNLTKNLPKLSNPWTFSWFDEILPNLPFFLLHVILDLG